MSEQLSSPQTSSPLAGAALVERIRAKSADVVLAVYRIVKNALVHATDNAAVRESAAHGGAALAAFAREIDAPVTLSFLGDTIFVCGHLLRAEVRLRKRDRARRHPRPRRRLRSDLRQRHRPGGTPVVRGRGRARRSLRRGGESNRPRSADPRDRGPRDRRRAPPTTDRRDARRAGSRLYATALVAVRELCEDVAQGRTVLPQRIKRIAQRLVLLAEREDPAMLGMTTMAKAHRDDSGRAVQTAILVLAMARQITRDRIVLSQLVCQRCCSTSGAFASTDASATGC